MGGSSSGFHVPGSGVRFDGFGFRFRKGGPQAGSDLERGDLNDDLI